MFKRGAFKHKVWEPVPTDFTETVRRSVPCAVCRGLRAARAKRPFPSRFCRAHLRKGLGGREGDEAEPAGFGRLIGVHDHLATTTNALDKKKTPRKRQVPQFAADSQDDGGDVIAVVVVIVIIIIVIIIIIIIIIIIVVSQKTVSCHKKQFRHRARPVQPRRVLQQLASVKRQKGTETAVKRPHLSVGDGSETGEGVA